MTLEEKIGQMVQSAGADTTAIGGEVKTSPLEGLIAEGKIGSIIYMPDSAAMARRLQRIAVEKSRLGIPLIFCQDVIHGFQTIFPIPLGWSCSFDPDLVRRATEISAREATRAGVMLAFAPMRATRAGAASPRARARTRSWTPAWRAPRSWATRAARADRAWATASTWPAA